MFKLAGQGGGRLQIPDSTRSVNWFHLALRKFHLLEFFIGTGLMGSMGGVRKDDAGTRGWNPGQCNVVRGQLNLQRLGLGWKWCPMYQSKGIWLFTVKEQGDLGVG